MAKISQRVDRLSRSIINKLSGDSFDTDMIELQKDDLKTLIKGWKFDWRLEASTGNVYKLVIRISPKVIQGLISIKDNGDHIFMKLIESANHNKGRNKIYEGVAGNLVAFACLQSLAKGYNGVVAFEAKTKLIEHYRTTLNARLYSGNKMYIDEKTALLLIDKYFNK